MKRFVMIISIIAILMLPTAAYADAPRTEKAILADYEVQQKIYDENTDLAGTYLNELTTSRLTFIQCLKLEMQLKEAREKYNAAADEMQKLRIELFELKNERDA